ncbi:DNA polymerase III subunit alpha [Actinomyces vulturis]|uniref:DNA polymerase III subunit alpha n=1 Tax=Actinomyces vulturis TaxID=1857645 RepID=UPI000A92EB46|nr:DNA polymerase III subunit alpha [Actinomyces vulturis]
MFERFSGYAELHAHSCYSFADGVNEPEELVYAAQTHQLSALGLIDHDGFPGVMRFASAAREHHMPTMVGTELTTPYGAHIPLLTRNLQGYKDACRMISQRNLEAGKRIEQHYSVSDLAQYNHGNWMFLTGTRNGPLRRALCSEHSTSPHRWDMAKAQQCLDELMDLWGRDNLIVELTLDGTAMDVPITTALADLAKKNSLPLVATGAVRCATPASAHLVDVAAALRHGCTVEELRASTPAYGSWIRSTQEMIRLYRHCPQSVEVTREWAQELSWDISLLHPGLPLPDVPEGMTIENYLRELTYQGAQRYYGTRQEHPRAWQTIDHELEVIESLGFSGYFLIVYDIVQFCHQQGIFCQGRGSAANSAVCYALSITAVDAVRHQMLFERFLSSGRTGPPDIDLDIESKRREEVITYVYERYGRECAAQVGTFITYGPRSALRDAGRALGYSTGVQDSWIRQMDRSFRQALRHGDNGPVPSVVADIARQLLDRPRHSGVHSGGMVLCAEPVTQIVPVHWAAMKGRSVVQWDKEDCAEAGLVKFDLLGLGMLTVLRLAMESLSYRGIQPPTRPGERPLLQEINGDGGHTVKEHDHVSEEHEAHLDTSVPLVEEVVAARFIKEWKLQDLPHDDPEVYGLLCAADTVGIFQVESRAQMATLPRLKPQCFYDIVIEVAIIRPGPIQGNAVHPYIRRRMGKEKVTYLHEKVRPSVEKTLGVALFQEQLMNIAIEAASFTPREADELRSAMTSKRSQRRMARIKDRFYQGMRSNDVDEPTIETVWTNIESFALYGFPESHAFSFAYLVYTSAWLKVHHPEDFYAALLSAQPMGFWSPATIVYDAQRHGVRVAPIDINFSQVTAHVRQCSDSDHRVAVIEGDQFQELPCSDDAVFTLHVHSEYEVRLGLASVQGISVDKAEEIICERGNNGPFTSAENLVDRVSLTRQEIEALAHSGALESCDGPRRKSLWNAQHLAARKDHPNGTRCLPGLEIDNNTPSLPLMSNDEQRVADIRFSGVTVRGHVMGAYREALSAQGIVSTNEVDQHAQQRIRVAGVITHRQRPHTKTGMIFLNLEDEHGLLNVMCPAPVWARYKTVGLTCEAIIVRGMAQKEGAVVAVMAEVLEPLVPRGMIQGRNWC